MARHAAIDALRRDGRSEALPEDDGPDALPAVAAPAGRFAGELDDDELALLFAACHPALPPASQVALALRTLGGFGLAVLAPLLFTTEAALAQRLARAQPPRGPVARPLGRRHAAPGLRALRASQRGGTLSRWHLQAGIAGEHALAEDPARTDWHAIGRYYEMLLALDPSAAPRLGHAIALAEGGAPAEARTRLLVLLPRVPPALRAHTLAALARACERLGDAAAAADWRAQAIAAAPHPADARLLARHGL